MTNSKKKKLSQTEMILISLYRVAEGTTEKVPEEEIVIEAWKKFPHSFSLRNHPEYPEGSAVSKRMADKLKPQGLVIGLGDNIFRLTDKGIKKAENILPALGNVPSIEKNSLPSFIQRRRKFYQPCIKNSGILGMEKQQSYRFN